MRPGSVCRHLKIAGRVLMAQFFHNTSGQLESCNTSVEFDPLYRPATRGLHYGQELGSANRPDTFEQTKPPTTKILLAIGRRTLHSLPPRRLRTCYNDHVRKPKPGESLIIPGLKMGGQVTLFRQFFRLIQPMCKLREPTSVCDGTTVPIANFT